MRRIVVCLMIAFASATVAARESKLSDADGGSCPTRSSRPAASASRAADRDMAAPVPAKKAKAVLPGGGDDVRLPSPRWHRFLPGMFR